MSARNQPAALRRLLHPRLRWTTHRGTVLDREAYLDSNVGGELTWLSQSLDDVDVQVVGDRVAVLTALVTDMVVRGVVEQMFRMRLTQTWVRTETGWVCLSRHAGPSVVRGDEFQALGTDAAVQGVDEGEQRAQ